MEDAEANLRQLHALRELGVVLKIDRHLGASSREHLRCGLAEPRCPARHDGDLPVEPEGVEDDDQLKANFASGKRA